MDRNKKTITKEDLLFGSKAKKTVDINDDDDFPDLDEDGPSFPVMGKQKSRGAPQPQPKRQTTSNWGLDTLQDNGNKFSIGG